MKVHLYKCTVDRRKVDKTNSITLIKSISNVAIHGDVSISSPILRLDGDIDNISTVNYMYIPKFKRYYFIEDITLSTGGIVLISGKCDVLMSFKNDILPIKCTITRQEHKTNDLLIDNRLLLNNNKTVTYKTFPSSPFSVANMTANNNCVALTVSGGK